MADANKAACDSKLGKWMLVGGNGYKMTLPNKAWEKDGDEPPFNVYAPDAQKAPSSCMNTSQAERLLMQRSS